MPSQFIWQKDDLPIPLMLEVTLDNLPVSGISPTVEIYKYPTHQYIDFNTNTFVLSGGNKFGSMSGVPSNNGLYQRKFDPRDYGQSGINQVYYARYRAIIPSGFDDLTSNIEVIGSEIHYFTELIENPGMTASFEE